MNRPMAGNKIVGFCDQYVQITYNQPAAESIINFLCADLEVAPNIRSAAEQSVTPHAVCELNVGEDEHFTLQRNGESLYQGRCQRELAYALINEIIFQCLDKNDVGLALHAAAVQVAKGGILLPGNSGAGKSTFVAWLVACGCGYLTDELVVLTEDTFCLRPFTRPLTIRSASAKALAPYVQLKEINPSIKTLLSSGYSINGKAQAILNDGYSGFIQKPFNLTHLSHKIRKILDRE